MQHSAMATQLSLLLLLMLGSVASNDIFGVYLNKMCGNTPSSAELHAPECPERSEPPCRTTNRTETLALPLLLSLNTGSSTGHPELQLYDDAGTGCGLVLGNNTGNQMTLTGAVCGGARNTISAPLSSASGGWLHVVIISEGHQVRVYFRGDKNKPLTLTCQDSLPSTVKVDPHISTYGYSALTPDDVDAATTAHPLLLALCAALAILVFVL